MKNALLLILFVTSMFCTTEVQPRKRYHYYSGTCIDVGGNCFDNGCQENQQRTMAYCFSEKYCCIPKR